MAACEHVRLVAAPALCMTRRHCPLCLQVELRRSKLLWLEVKRLKAVALKSREMAAKNADKVKERTMELARQKGPFRSAKHPEMLRH